MAKAKSYSSIRIVSGEAKYEKTHTDKKALLSHLGKIKKRKGKAVVSGKTISYSFKKK